MHATLTAFQNSGWRVSVIVDEEGAGGIVEGLHTVRAPSARETLRLYRSADVVFTQLGSRNRATRWSTLTTRPLVLFLRMGDLDPDTLLARPALVVFNASWLREQSRWTGPSFVQHPPVDPDRFRTTPGGAVTLVNLSDRKGAPVLVELARRCPDLDFLGVRGGWGQQLDVSAVDNLSIIGPVDDMREVYGRTRVLLMPSSEEPFGRVGVEAAASGIPTVATPLPGIREALGDSALYAHRSDVDAWVDHVRALMSDDRLWQRHSRRATERAECWAAQDELGRLVEAIESLREPDHG